MSITQPSTAEKVKQTLAATAEWVWAEKPFIVMALGGVVVFCQAAGYAVPAWLLGACAVAGCGGYGYLHYATR